nr:transposase [Candidatus Dependentiae bacterium]
VEWVALKSGKTYQEFAEKGTTRTCHACAFVVDGGIHPSIRTWKCPGCSTEHIRDENAACNGLIKILPATSLVRWVKENPKKISRECSLPVPGSGRVLIEERWAWRVLSSGTLVCRGGKTADSSAPPRN